MICTIDMSLHVPAQTLTKALAWVTIDDYLLTVRIPKCNPPLHYISSHLQKAPLCVEELALDATLSNKDDLYCVRYSPTLCLCPMSLGSIAESEHSIPTLFVTSCKLQRHPTLLLSP